MTTDFIIPKELNDRLEDGARKMSLSLDDFVLFLLEEDAKYKLKNH